MPSTAIIASSDKGLALATSLVKELPDSAVYSTRKGSEVNDIESIAKFLSGSIGNFSQLVFIGALGICVRSIAPYIFDKKTDPAVINIDAKGCFIQSVLSGHTGGANQLAEKLARITGGQAIISTTSDVDDLWPLDILHKQYGWQLDPEGELTKMIASFVNKEPVALLLEARDKGTNFLEKTCPEHVHIFYRSDDIIQSDYKLILAVSPYLYRFNIPAIFYRPPMLAVGAGCKKDVDPEAFIAATKALFETQNLSLKSIASLNSIDIKSEEPALQDFCKSLNIPFNTYSSLELAKITVPNPSEKVFETVGCYGVAESSAMLQSGASRLAVEKQKININGTESATMAIALLPEYERTAYVHIVGAGPGDPELVSVRGKRLLEQADLILYAGSLVPEELTHYAKPSATVLSSAGMNLEEQIDCMQDFYSRGLLIVRLHTGDPCLYGAIQEQMSRMDELSMHYAITPGISAFQAAASRLKSQFTVPERVQSIILTRGEGRTPMPEKEQLHKLAQSQATMCIYLSATLVDKVQADLLKHYPEDTPVAVCHKLTWPEEKIWKGTLSELATIVKSNNLTLTTLLVVGEAIDARGHYSKLYDRHFTHGTRKAVE